MDTAPKTLLSSNWSSFQLSLPYFPTHQEVSFMAALTTAY
jgi:hypothetical protein